MEQTKYRKIGTFYETSADFEEARQMVWYTDIDGILKHESEGKFFLYYEKVEPVKEEKEK